MKIIICYIFATLIGAQTALSAFPEKTIPKDKGNGSSYTYVSVGVGIPIPVPNFQVGRREKFDNSAVDVSIGLVTAVIASRIYGNCSYLKYVNEGKYYIGAGGSVEVAVLFCEPFINYGLTPTFCVGKENEKRFHQIRASLISFTPIGIGIYPDIAYQYGFKF